MPDLWQRATVIGVPIGNEETFTFLTAIMEEGFGAGGDVAKKAKEDLNLQENEVVEITLTDGPDKQVKDVRRLPIISGAGLGRAASAA